MKDIKIWDMEKEKGGSLALAGSVEMGGAACNKKYSHVLTLYCIKA